MGDLKPCPFCGGSDIAERETETHDGPYIWFVCEGCYAETDGGQGREAAVAIWNRRAPTTPAQPERGGDEAEGGVKPKAPDAAEVVVTDAMVKASAVALAIEWFTAPGESQHSKDMAATQWESFASMARVALKAAMISTAEQEGRA